MTGTGTALDPYIVSTLTDLNAVRNNCGKVYKLANDIDASATSGWNGGTGWIPIPYFWGTFDGDGYVIRNLTSNNNARSTGGFFELIVGTVKNLGVEYTYFKGGYQQAGLFAAQIASNALVSCCYAKGTLNIGYSSGVEAWNGGFVGYVNCSSASYGVTNCFVWSDMTGAGYTSNMNGGFVGKFNAGKIWYSYACGASGQYSSLNATGTNSGFVSSKRSEASILTDMYLSYRSDTYAVSKSMYHTIDNLSSTYWDVDATNVKNSGFAYLKEFFKSRGKIESRSISTWAKPAKKTIVRARHKSYGISITMDGSSISLDDLKSKTKVLTSFLSDSTISLEIETLFGKRESIILTTSVNITSNLLKNVLLSKELKSFLEGINTETQTQSKSAREIYATIKGIKTKVLALNNNAVIVWANHTTLEGIIYRLKVLPSIRHFVFPESNGAKNICKAMDVSKRIRVRVITAQLKPIKSKSIPVVTTMNLKMFITVGMKHFKSTVTAIGNVKKYRILVATIGNITSSVGLNGTLKVSRTIKTLAPQIKSSYLKQININRNITVNSNTIISVVRVKGFTVNDRIIDASMGAINTFIVKNVETYREVKSTLMDCNTSVSPYNENFRFARVRMIRITKEIETKRPFVYGKISTKERVIIPSTRERVIIQTSNERKVPINIV